MRHSFYDPLQYYFNKVAQFLSRLFNLDGLFQSNEELMSSMEKFYSDFILPNLPLRSTVRRRGLLFGDDGSESKIMDLIISSAKASSYNFHDEKGRNQCFAPVDSCIAVAAIRSRLTKRNLVDCLQKMASLPLTHVDGRIVHFVLHGERYESRPYKIIYATDGPKAEETMKRINDFYAKNPDIPFYGRPDIIHVANQYVVYKFNDGIAEDYKEDMGDESIGRFFFTTKTPDRQAIKWTIAALQKNVISSNHNF